MKNGESQIWPSLLLHDVGECNWLMSMFSRTISLNYMYLCVIIVLGLILYSRFEASLEEYSKPQTICVAVAYATHAPMSVLTSSW